MKLMGNLINFLTGFRKFTMAILFIAVSLTLLLTRFITGSEFILTTRDVVVAFITANVGEHIVGAVKEWIKKKK